MINENYKYSKLTSEIIGASMIVHQTLKNGFQEVIYQRALALELERANIEAVREFTMPVMYKDLQIGTRRVDFLVEGKISVEIKAVIKLEPTHLAQAINYLEVYNLQIGLLINFGEPRLRFHRLENKKFRP
ncbi:MAG: GxxExxY protein [Bacteroidia bacterium]